MQDLQVLKTLLDTPKRMVVTMHQRPDADALGSALALFHYLLQLGNTVHIISPSEYPDFLNWLPGTPKVIIYSSETHTRVEELMHKAEVIFCLDFQAYNRLGALEHMVRESKATTVVIDHHPTTEVFGDLVFRDIKIGSTAEYIYHLLELFGAVDRINIDIACCLYAGILVDTDLLSTTSVSPRTHRIIASLIELGLDTTSVHKAIYEDNPLRKVQFLGFALSERLVVLPEYHAAYCYITSDDYKRFNLQTGDTENLIKHVLSIRGVRVAAVIKEKPGAIRLSIRSVGDIHVNEWARNYFAGGGHKNAAGGSSTKSLQDTIHQWETLVKKSFADWSLVEAVGQKPACVK